MTDIVDIHTHILPGIDDGAKNWDVCMQMIQKSWKAGVKRIFATPHFWPWGKNVAPATIYNLCSEAHWRAKKELGIEIPIYPGNEIFYHVDMIESIKSGRALTLAGSSTVLVEFPVDIPYQLFYRGIRDICDAHYLPVIAHMERYLCLRKPGRIEELEEIGAMLQMNVEAFQGGFFDETSRWSKKCLQSQKIHFLASDMHNTGSRPPMSKEQLEWAAKKLKKNYLKEILSGNSRKIYPL